MNAYPLSNQECPRIREPIRVWSPRHETLSFVLNVRPSRPSIATQYACVSLPEENGQDFQEFLDAKSRPPGNLGSTTECVSMNTLLVKFHTLILPELPEGPLVWDASDFIRNTRWTAAGDARWPSCPRRGGQSSPRDARLCLECWVPRGPSGQHHAHVMWSRVMMLKLPVEEAKMSISAMTVSMATPEFTALRGQSNAPGFLPKENGHDFQGLHEA